MVEKSFGQAKRIKRRKSSTLDIIDQTQLAIEGNRKVNQVMSLDVATSHPGRPAETSTSMDPKWHQMFPDTISPCGLARPSGLPGQQRLATAGFYEASDD
jgi:hypothetical protein